MCVVWEERKLYAGFWWGEVKERDSQEDLSVERKVILKLITNK